MGHIGVGWGGSCRGGVGWGVMQGGVGCVMQGCGGVGHVGVGWGGSSRGGWVSYSCRGIYTQLFMSDSNSTNNNS